MNDTRLIKIIRTFSKDDLKSFGKFLNSPFLTYTRNTVDLFDYIVRFHPEYDSPKLEKEIIFSKLFKDEKFAAGKLNNLIFDLTKAAENFVAHATLHEDEIEFLLNLSRGYLNRGLLDESNRINKQIEKNLLPGFSPRKDFISKYKRLTYLNSAYYTERNDFEKIIEYTKNYFEASAVQFIIDYTSIISSQYAAIDTYGKKMENNFINSILKSFDIEKLISLLEKDGYISTSLVALHYYKLKTIQEPENLDYYFLLKETFFENLSRLDREEKYIIFSYLANYCVTNLLKQNKTLRNEGLEIYKSMMENNAYSFSESEFMQVITYRNVIHFCVSVKETVWFEHFIKNYTDYLNPDYREDMKHLSHAHLFFIKEEYEKALAMISKINHEFFLFKTDLKNLMLKIYYELNYFEQAFSMVDTYKHFLASSKEITKSFKVNFNNFLNFYFDLLKIKCGQSKELPSFIKSRIEKENDLVGRNWLVEKTEELIG